MSIVKHSSYNMIRHNLVKQIQNTEFCVFLFVVVLCSCFLLFIYLFSFVYSSILCMHWIYTFQPFLNKIGRVFNRCDEAHQVQIECMQILLQRMLGIDSMKWKGRKERQGERNEKKYRKINNNQIYTLKTYITSLALPVRRVFIT